MRTKDLYRAALMAYTVQSCLKSAAPADFARGTNALASLCEVAGGLDLLNLVKDLLEQ